MLRADFWGMCCIPDRRGLPGQFYTSIKKIIESGLNINLIFGGVFD